MYKRLTTLLQMTQSLNALRLIILRSRFLGTPVSPNSNVMRQYKGLLPAVLSVFQRDMLIGLMLGDACLK